MYQHPAHAATFIVTDQHDRGRENVNPTRDGV
jgi:hypothetical protein